MIDSLLVWGTCGQLSVIVVVIIIDVRKNGIFPNSVGNVSIPNRTGNGYDGSTYMFESLGATSYYQDLSMQRPREYNLTVKRIRKTKRNIFVGRDSARKLESFQMSRSMAKTKK
jgi:hypothetical protein